ncbi:MAG: hypothetical protein WC562_04520 [Dehalococcoidia bacterium]
MECKFCLYYQPDGSCRMHGKPTAEQLVKGCASYVDQPFGLSSATGCCGLAGMPLGDQDAACEADKRQG